MTAIYGRDFARVYNEKWESWTERISPFLVEVARQRYPKASSWLDLCCGTGFLLRRVVRRGFSAVGVDSSRHQIRHAKRNAPTARFVCRDIREFRLPHRFDVITCMFDSLNYLTTKSDLLKAFRNAKRHLAGAGVFVFDMNTFEGLEDSWCRTSATDEQDLTLILQTSFDPKRAVGPCLITGFVRNARLFRRFQEEHLQRGYKASEIEELLEKVGLSFRKYDGRTLGRPKKRSGRLIYVCEITRGKLIA